MRYIVENKELIPILTALIVLWIFRCNCASYFGDVVPLKKECFPG